MQPSTITLAVCTILICSSLTPRSVEAGKCSRTPDGHGALKTPADGRFHIRISENTAKYTPGKTYTSKRLFYLIFFIFINLPHRSYSGRHRCWHSSSFNATAAQIFRFHVGGREKIQWIRHWRITCIVRCLHAIARQHIDKNFLCQYGHSHDDHTEKWSSGSDFVKYVFYLIILTITTTHRSCGQHRNQEVDAFRLRQL